MLRRGEVPLHLVLGCNQHLAYALDEGELPPIKQSGNPMLGHAEGAADILGTPNQV